MKSLFLRQFQSRELPRCLAVRLTLSGILCCAPSVLLSAESAGNSLEEHYDGVLGTSFDLTIYAGNADELDTAGAAAIAEIARLEKILSTWLADSELMQLNDTHQTQAASVDLLAVVNHCESWFERSSGMFSCRLKPVLDLWDAAVREQKIPNILDMQPLARAAHQAEVGIDAERNHIVLDEAIGLEPSGLAKGYIIDRVMDVLRSAVPTATAIKVDIGGDASYWGSPPGQQGWAVHIADPQLPADNAGFVSSLALTSMAVATSGHTSRVRTINTREFSHILVPERGWPVSSGVYAAVVAPDAVTADAVATALAAQSLEAGIAWVNSQQNVAALLIGSDGMQRTSRDWNQYLSEDMARQAAATIVMTIDYQIPNLNERGYERPYVAIWVGNTQGKGLKNLLLLGGEQRWASTNTRWWNNTHKRADGVSRPTRGPGEYQLVWDGKDDFGALLPPGDYLLNIEASREGGGHDYRSIPFSLSEGVQTIKQAADGEIGNLGISIEMRMPE